MEDLRRILPEKKRHIRWNGLACQLDDLAGQTSAILERASIAVGAVVSDGREEGVEEVALFTMSVKSHGPAGGVKDETYMSVVNLNDIKPCLERALKSSDPRNLEVLDILQ